MQSYPSLVDKLGLPKLDASIYPPSLQVWGLPKLDAVYIPPSLQVWGYLSWMQSISLLVYKCGVT